MRTMLIIPLILICSSTIYYEDMTMVLNEFNVELIDAKNLNYYEWERVYRNNTYIDPDNFIDLVKDFNIISVHFFISNCPSANVVNFYLKHQDQSFACVVVYKKNHVVDQSYLTRIASLERQSIIFLIIIISFLALHFITKSKIQRLKRRIQKLENRGV